MRPRVIAVTSEPPWPLDSGGHIRSFHLLRALARSTPVRLICPVESENTASLTPLAEAGLDLRPVVVGRRTPLGETARIVKALGRHEPYLMYRRYHWPA